MYFFALALTLALLFASSTTCNGELIVSGNSTIVVASCGFASTPLLFGCGDTLNNTGITDIRISLNVTLANRTQCREQMALLKTVPRYAANETTNCTIVSWPQHNLPHIPRNPFPCETYWFNVVTTVSGKRISTCDDLLSAMVGERCNLVDDDVGRFLCHTFSSVADVFLFAAFRALPVLNLACTVAQELALQAVVPSKNSSIARLACDGFCPEHLHNTTQECEAFLLKHNDAHYVTMASPFLGMFVAAIAAMLTF